MSLTITEIIADSRSQLYEPTSGRRYTDAELIRWANFTLDEVQGSLGFQKKTASVLGSTNIAALGTTPRFYELPADFISLDKNEGVKINGLRRLPTTGAEVDLFQQKAIVGALDNTTITIDDYFTESFTGLIFHYAISYVSSTEVAAGRSGNLIWFTPNPEDADTIEYTYIMLPTQYTAGGATTSLLIRHTSEVLILGTVWRAMRKAYYGNAATLEKVAYAESVYRNAIADAKKYYDDFKKATDQQPRIKTARQVYGMYNSRDRTGTDSTIE